VRIQHAEPHSGDGVDHLDQRVGEAETEQRGDDKADAEEERAKPRLRSPNGLMGQKLTTV